MKRNVNFGLLSLNARGIRTFEKRKALFLWLSKNKADIVFLQETYSSPDVEKLWKTQWKGDLYFAHGSEHSRGVLILVKEGPLYGQCAGAAVSVFVSIYAQPGL